MTCSVVVGHAQGFWCTTPQLRTRLPNTGLGTVFDLDLARDGELIHVNHSGQNTYVYPDAAIARFPMQIG